MVNKTEMTKAGEKEKVKLFIEAPQRLNRRIYDIAVTVKADERPAKQFKAHHHFALNPSEYLAKSDDRYYITDNSLDPAFLTVAVQCVIGQVVAYEFQFGWNDIASVQDKRMICFGKRAEWANSIDFSQISEDDMQYRLYLTVRHDRKAQVIVFSDLAFVFPYEFGW